MLGVGATRLKAGTFLYVRMLGSDDYHVETWAVTGYRRGARPKMIMLGACELQADGRTVVATFDRETGFDFHLAVSFFGILAKAAHEHAILEVHCAVAPADKTHHVASTTQIYLKEDWRHLVASTEQQLFPSLVQAPRPPSQSAPARRAIQRLQGKRAPRAPGIPLPVHFVAPQVIGAPSKCQSESSSSDCAAEPDSSSSNSDGFNDDPLPPPPDAEQDHAGGAQPPSPEPEIIPGLPKQRDGQPWPHWKIGRYGYLVYNQQADSLGAHCSAHGSLCRVNKVCSRHGLGYLLAFLMEPHRAGSEVHNHLEHVRFTGWLRSREGCRTRAAARMWLLSSPAEVEPSPGQTFNSLLDLERAQISFWAEGLVQ